MSDSVHRPPVPRTESFQHKRHAAPILPGLRVRSHTRDNMWKFSVGRFCSQASKDGRALQHVAKRFKADREVVLAAVRNNLKALNFAAKELRGDR